MKKITYSVTKFLLFTVVIYMSYLPLMAQRGNSSNITPQELYERVINTINFPSGERFCWQARGGLSQFINKYESTKNTEWLDAGFRYCDFLIGKMDTSPDGYKGWIGPFLSDMKYYQDVLVGDALLFEGILDYCILVKENKDLEKKYGEKIKPYIESVKKDFVEKYDKRGTWIDDGPYGGYINSDKFLKEGNLKEWIIAPNAAEANQSHPFNKQMDAGIVFIKLYKLTKDNFYRDRAVKIFFTAKSHFQYFDNHYCWNYWEPLYPGDINMERHNTRHGVWVHSWRSGYQAGEVGKIVEAYNYGIVFDEQDIKRIINTNLDVMWNKDRENPKFINSNGLGADGDTSGMAAFQRAYGHSNVTKNTGELWTSLLDFDQTIRNLYALRFKNNPDSEAAVRFKTKMQNNPPSFKRKNVVGKVIVPKITFTECKDLDLATVLPHIVPKDGKSIIICKSWNPGELQIDLISKTGAKLANLYTGTISKQRIFLITWDGKDPSGKATYKGEYKIRWTINGGYREFPVVIN